MIIMPKAKGYNWEYTLFSDKPIYIYMHICIYYKEHTPNSPNFPLLSPLPRLLRRDLCFRGAQQHDERGRG